MASGLLVSFAGYPATISSLFPDNGLASLAATLVAAGHQVKILDYNTVSTVQRLADGGRTATLRELLPRLREEPDDALLATLREISAALERDVEREARRLTEEIADEVATRRCHFVGFKLWSGDGFDASARIGRELRRRFPRLRIIAGGPAVLFAEHAIFSAAADVFDVLVDGEGERAILGLAAWAERSSGLEEVPNLLLPDGRRTRRELLADLDVLPMPVYDGDVYRIRGDEQLKLFVVDESRGCPMRCAFCVHRHASGDRWRVRTPQRVLAETEALRAAHGVRAVRFGGSYTPTRLFAQIAAIGGLQVRYSAFAHPDGLRRSLLDSIAASGCRALFFGVESFSAADSAALGKHVDGDRALEVLSGCQTAGITPVVSLIVPLPGQSEQSLACNHAASVELCSRGPAAIVTQFPGLVPRTRWWDERDHFGFRLEGSEEGYRHELARYKIRHLLPPPFWEPLSYAVDGQSFSAYTRATAAFQRELTASGAAVNVSDEVVLLSDLLSEPLLSLRDRLQRMFYTLDAEAIREFVIEANAALRA